MLPLPPCQIYLSALEVSKSLSAALIAPLELSDTAAVGAASFVGGAMASLSSQAVVVPIDVVAQRLMLLGGGPPGGPGGAAARDPNARALAAADAAAARHTSGLALARRIVRSEGVGGLYRGFGASLAMFVPNSAIWWVVGPPLSVGECARGCRPWPAPALPCGLLVDRSRLFC